MNTILFAISVVSAVIAIIIGMYLILKGTEEGR